MKRFTLRHLITLLSAAGVLTLSSHVLAGGFQLWEQDAASVGNYHAGYAALAQDASIAFYNPAGITRFKNQQLVLGVGAVMTDFKYQGTISVNTINGGAPRSVTAQGGNFSLIPALSYVAPINDCIGFGFTVNVPYGLKTTYGRTTILRYAATTTGATVVDISPSLGVQITDKLSVGAGFDIQKMDAEFDEVGGLGFPATDAESINKLDDTGYGGHGGILYQFSPDSRVGLSYHSQVVHHLNGSSAFTGPLAVAFNDSNYSSHANSNITLPAYTALSMYQRIHPQVAIMGSVIYTQWNILRTLSINNVSGIADLDPSQNITVTVVKLYRNTWNVAVGADYYVCDNLTLRGGVGYDQSPVLSGYRDVELPDSNKVAAAIGGHYQASKTIGFDVGWTHFFVGRAVIHPPAQVAGDQETTTNGHITGGADVLAGQIVWDIE